MTRSLILVIALTGAAGLAIGWRSTGPRAEPEPAHRDHSFDPPAEEGDPALFKPSRREFPLGPADIHADRETPALAVDAEGRVVLAWASQTGEDERTIFLARSPDRGATFAEPVAWRKVPIYRFTSRSQGKGKAMAYSTHVLPRLAAGRDGIDLGWVEAIDGGPSVVFYVAWSRDGGQTFSKPVRVHGGDASRPGFTTLAADPDGTVSAAWLDGRNKGQQPFVAIRPAGSEGFDPERLAYAGPEDKGVCPCCDVATLRTSDGRQVVALRNNDRGHRDIWLTRSLADGTPGFEAPVAVTSEPWSFDGCPHDGPSLALSQDQLHVLWMDAHTGKGRIYAARSPLSSWSFSSRAVSPKATGAQGHPKLLGSGRRLLAVWDEALDDAEAPKPAGYHEHGHGSSLAGSGRAVMLAVSTDEGGSFEPARPVAPRPGAFQINPTLALGGDGSILVAWNELDAEGKRVVFVRVKSPEAPAQFDRGDR